MADVAEVELGRRRTTWDVVLGILSVVAGFVVLGHVAIASLVSVLFLGWMLIIGGVMVAISGIIGWKHPSHRWDLPAGALFVVLGLGFVRNPGTGLLVLTLLAGSMLLLGGIVRIIASFQAGAPRAVLLFNGVLTLVLGLLVLNRWPVSALWFLGTVLGIQLILDGITTALVGRLYVLRPMASEAAAPA